MRAAFIAALSALGCGVALANDFPTADRMQYVFDCMRERPDASHFEMIYKCSCVVDEIAAQVPYSEFVELWTATRGVTIAGERGSALRDSKVSRDMVKKYRETEGKAKEKCFLK